MQQMLQHDRSIYVAEIGQILRSVNGSIRIMSYFNGLVAARLWSANFLMLQLCCSKDRSMNFAAANEEGARLARAPRSKPA